MNKLTITHIIGTYDVGTGADEIADVAAYRDEVQEKLVAEFPDARNIDVVIENGYSKTRVEGLTIDEMMDGQDEQIIERVTQIANDIWNNGAWHGI